MCIRSLDTAYPLGDARIEEHRAVAEAVGRGERALVVRLLDDHMGDALAGLVPPLTAQAPTGSAERRIDDARRAGGTARTPAGARPAAYDARPGRDNLPLGERRVAEPAVAVPSRRRSRR